MKYESITIKICNIKIDILSRVIKISTFCHLVSYQDTQRLRKLYDSCEARNRALKSLGVNEESYSTIVVPSILEKMPEQFRLTITRGTSFIERTMQEMLQAFEKELELREAHVTLSLRELSETRQDM